MAAQLISRRGRTNRAAAILLLTTSTTAAFGQCGGAWSALSPSGPSPRNGCAVAFNPARGTLALFGGNTPNTTTFQATTWELQDSGSGLSWVQINSIGPSARGGVQMVTDSLRGRVVLFGGSNSTTKSNETWVLLGGAWAQYALPTPLPSARDQYALAYDTFRDRVVLFGGSDGTNTRLNDTWEFDAETWTRVATTGPSPRLGASMSFDETRGVCVLFGGSVAGNNSIGDTWEWDGAMWMQRSPGGTASEPTTRAHAGLAFESERQRIVLFGGATIAAGVSTFRNDTWEWDGVSWRRILQTGPVARDLVRLVYDPTQRGLIFYGGRDGATTGREDTQRFQYAFPVVAMQPAPATTCLGGMASFSTMVSAGGPLSYQWRQDGEDLVNGATPEGTVIAGATSPTLTLTNVASVQLGLYDCVITDPCGQVTTEPAELSGSVCIADVDCSNTVALGDLFLYLSLWFAGNPRADLNGVDGVSVQDLFDYLVLYFAGCD